MSKQRITKSSTLPKYEVNYIVLRQHTTIQQLLKHNPKSLVLLSHLGQSNGRKNPENSLKIVMEPLQSLLGRPVTFLNECVGEHIYNEVNSSNGCIFLCENVRFHPEEEGFNIDDKGNKFHCSPQQI